MKSAYLTLAAAGALALTGCFLGEPEPEPPIIPPYEGSPCVEVPAAARAKADSLVAAGNREMVDNFDYWFSRSDSWWEAKARSPQAALNRYDQALAVAPGHCQAVFGKAIASATMLTQDARMDDFIRKVEAAQDSDGDVVLAKRASFAGLFRTRPEEAAPALVKLSASLKRVDGPSIKEAQALIEEVIMPKLDATIAALATVMDYQMFAVRFDVDGDTVEIDRGEVGPGLAGLKVAKAWLTVVAGYNIDPAPDESWDWYRTLEGIDDEDFDRLSPAQEDALDHLTGLFQVGSPFTRMKPAWKTRITAIPELLLSAVDDAQKGLESAIAEARSGDPQRHDVWRAGSGEDADVDTADLRGAIVFLERSKKYLHGEVPVEYFRGTQVVKVDFTRLFHVDGAQNLLPHFKFLPYAQWNDTVSADTSWGPWMGEEAEGEIYARLGYDAAWLQEYHPDWQVHIIDSLAWGGEFPQRVAARRVVLTRFGFDTTGTSNNYLVLAAVDPDPANPCKSAMTRHYSLSRDPSNPDGYLLAASPSAGEFTLKACRVREGQAEYVSWIEADTRGPIEFTDKDGQVTLTIPDLEGIDKPLDLKGKIVFRDPTFGGVFPGQTNETFWQTVQTIADSPGDRVKRECRDIQREDGWWEYECTRELPSNPSDLDYLVYYLDWGEDVF
jgi:hypothetical protein